MPRKNQIISPYLRALQRSKLGPIVRDDLGPCLDCDYYQDKDGYPIIWNNELGRSTKVSRIVLSVTLERPIQEGYCALHHCDRSACIEATHLYEGTLSQNSQDRDRRHGNPSGKGSKNANAKLTENQVSDIKELLCLGIKVRKVAQQFYVADSTICNIKYNRQWTHVRVF